MKRLPTIVLAALFMAGCAGGTPGKVKPSFAYRPPPEVTEEPSATNEPLPTDEEPVVALTVAEAVEHAHEQGDYVLGVLYLSDESGGVRLCSLLTAADPPGCGDPSLSVKGVDASILTSVPKERGVRAVEIRLYGIVENGTITAAEVPSIP